MKKFILSLLVLISYCGVSDARGDFFAITAENEGYIRRHTSSGGTVHTIVETSSSTGSFSTANGVRVGRHSFGGNTYTYNAVLPFDLSAIPSGHVIVEASLSFSAKKNNFFFGNAPDADLYGLNFRSSNSVAGTDFYFDTSSVYDPSANLIQDSILKIGSTTTSFAPYTTDTNADTALASYLNSQLSTLSTNDIAFLRFSSDNGPGNYYNIGTSYGTTTGNTGAVLSITTTAVPEPSAFLFGSLVCTVMGLRSARRGRDRR